MTERPQVADDWSGFLPSRLPESDLQKMSMVFVIYCYSSDISLAKYKNGDSSCKIEVATQLLEKLLTWYPITPPI
jgi:hypothetical protein